jgi:hypothetical protein
MNTRTASDFEDPALIGPRQRSEIGWLSPFCDAARMGQ